MISHMSHGLPLNSIYKQDKGHINSYLPGTGDTVVMMAVPPDRG